MLGSPHPWSVTFPSVPAPPPPEAFSSPGNWPTTLPLKERAVIVPPPCVGLPKGPGMLSPLAWTEAASKSTLPAAPAPPASTTIDPPMVPPVRRELAARASPLEETLPSVDLTVIVPPRGLAKAWTAYGPVESPRIEMSPKLKISIQPRPTPPVGPAEVSALSFPVGRRSRLSSASSPPSLPRTAPRRSGPDAPASADCCRGC